jgi:hypothetical protein
VVILRDCLWGIYESANQRKIFIAKGGKTMNIYLKSFIFLIVFSILHFGYDLTGWAFLVPFCGTNESVFQHLKMAFWAYLLLTVAIEYPFVRKKPEKAQDDKNSCGLSGFWYSRLLSVIILPWFIVIIWYLLPALYGKVELVWVDLVWAIAITYLSSLLAGYIEKDIEKVKFGLATRYVIMFLVFVSALLFIWFTYRLPWIDLFTVTKLCPKL